MTRASTRSSRAALVMTVIAGMLVSLFFFSGGGSVVVHTSLALPAAFAAFTQPLNGSQLSPQTNYTLLVAQSGNSTVEVYVNGSLFATLHTVGGIATSRIVFDAIGVYNLSATNSTGGQRQNILVYVGVQPNGGTFAPYGTFFNALLPEIFILLAGFLGSLILWGLGIDYPLLPLMFASVLASILFMTGFSGSTPATLDIYWVVLVLLVMLDVGLGVRVALSSREV